MCFLRSGPSKRLKIIKIRQLFILFLEIQKFIKIHQNSPNFDFAHKTYGFFNIFFLRTSFWAPFGLPVFSLQRFSYKNKWFLHHLCTTFVHPFFTSKYQVLCRKMYVSHISDLRSRISIFQVLSHVPGDIRFFDVM